MDVVGCVREQLLGASITCAFNFLIRMEILVQCQLANKIMEWSVE